MSIDYTYMHANDHGKISGCRIHIFQQASAVTLIDIIGALKQPDVLSAFQKAHAVGDISDAYEQS